MSAVDAPKPVDLAPVGAVESAPALGAPVLASDNVTEPTDAPLAEEAPKPVEGEAVAPLAEVKDDKPEVKAVEPIHTGSLGYKAPGLKNAFRFAKKYFWFGEEPVPSENLREYLRGEKPEIAHSVVAWSSQTGKGLLFFAKHADQKEHPAGVLNLAYATDLVKDGTLAFSLKISGHKHTFEAQNAPERNGWFVAVEHAITEAKAEKEGIESSEGYKEHKEKISKPTTLAGATTSAPKKSVDATPKLAEAEATGSEVPVVAAPVRAGSSSSSSSDEEKKARKAKNKSRSVSRKRQSIFGGLLGKKDKDSEAVKTEPEVKKEESVAPQLGEPSTTTTTTTAPVITQDIPAVGEELKTEANPTLATSPVDDVKTAESPVVATQEKPKPTKRGSIFGNFVEKLKSPTQEKKESDLIAPPAPAKDEPVVESSKPLDEAHVGLPAVVAPTSEPVVPKTEEKVGAPPGTPSKEKEHFSFGKLFGSKERAKSPAATDKAPEPKIDAAPKIEDESVAAPAVSEPVAEPIAEPIAPVVPTTETKPAEEVETPKKEKRTSFFGNLTRSLSKATGKKDVKKEEKKESTPIPEVAEETSEAPVLKDETPVVAAPTEKTVGDVPAEAVTLGEAPKSTATVPTTA